MAISKLTRMKIHSRWYRRGVVAHFSCDWLMARNWRWAWARQMVHASCDWVMAGNRGMVHVRWDRATAGTRSWRLDWFRVRMARVNLERGRPTSVGSLAWAAIVAGHTRIGASSLSSNKQRQEWMQKIELRISMTKSNTINEHLVLKTNTDENILTPDSDVHHVLEHDLGF